MLKTRNKTGFLFFFIGFVSFLGLSELHNVQKTISFTAFVVAVSALYLIKNVYAAYLISLLLMVGYSVYNISYGIFIIPVYLLIIVYRIIIKKVDNSGGKKRHNGDVGHSGLHFLIILGLAEIIYALVKLFENDFFSYYGDADELVVLAVALTAIFIGGSFSKRLEKKIQQVYKVNKKNYITLNLVNFVGMFLFFSSVFLHYGAYQDLQFDYYVVCFPWTIWLCVLVYEKNPITEAMLELIEEGIKKVSERRIKEK